MLKNVSRVQLAAAWFALVVVLFALSVVLGAAPSVGSAELWLVACLAPPIVMLFIWRAPTQTVAEVLYDATHSAKDGRR